MENEHHGGRGESDLNDLCSLVLTGGPVHRKCSISVGGSERIHSLSNMTSIAVDKSRLEFCLCDPHSEYLLSKYPVLQGVW